MSDYVSWHDQQASQMKENARWNDRQLRAIDGYAERLKAQDAAVIQSSVVEGRRATVERAAKAAEMVAAVKDRLAEVETKLRRREIAPSKAAREIKAARAELERLRSAAAGYETAVAHQDDQWSEPLKHADAMFQNAPSLQGDRLSVFDLGPNF